MKRLALAIAVLGLVGCFQPILGELSLWDLRRVPLLDDGWTVWRVLAAFGVAAIVGMTPGRLRAADALGAAAAFAFVIYTFRAGPCPDDPGFWGVVRHGGRGGLMMGGAAVLGAGIAIVGAWRAIRARVRA